MSTRLQNYYGISADLTENSATQTHKLGTMAETPNGRKFRYVKVGAAALVAGKVYDGPATVANHTNIAVAAAAAAGATQITVTLGATAATLNQYAEGYVAVNDVDGEGNVYQVKSHPAANASTSLVLTLEDPIRIALTTNSQVTLVSNLYNSVIIHATTETGIPVGVAVGAVTAAQFGWLQTRGVSAPLCNATTGIGEASSASDTTNAGGAEVGDGILAPIGYAVAAGVATEYNPVFLTID